MVTAAPAPEVDDGRRALARYRSARRSQLAEQTALAEAWAAPLAARGGLEDPDATALGWPDLGRDRVAATWAEERRRLEASCALSAAALAEHAEAAAAVEATREDALELGRRADLVRSDPAVLGLGKALPGARPSDLRPSDALRRRLQTSYAPVVASPPPHDVWAWLLEAERALDKLAETLLAQLAERDRRARIAGPSLRDAEALDGLEHRQRARLRRDLVARACRLSDLDVDRLPDALRESLLPLTLAGARARYLEAAWTHLVDRAASSAGPRFVDRAPEGDPRRTLPEGLAGYLEVARRLEAPTSTPSSVPPSRPRGTTWWAILLPDTDPSFLDEVVWSEGAAERARHEASLDARSAWKARADHAARRLDEALQADDEPPADAEGSDSGDSSGGAPR